MRTGNRRPRLEASGVGKRPGARLPARLCAWLGSLALVLALVVMLAAGCAGHDSSKTASSQSAYTGGIPTNTPAAAPAGRKMHPGTVGETSSAHAGGGASPGSSTGGAGAGPGKAQTVHSAVYNVYLAIGAAILIWLVGSAWYRRRHAHAPARVRRHTHPASRRRRRTR
jgi:hypothetical protein